MTLLPIGKIVQRAEAIGLSLYKLARLAAVNPATAWRIASGDSGGLVRTIGKLQTALERKERETLKALLEVHGVPEDGERAA